MLGPLYHMNQSNMNTSSNATYENSRILSSRNLVKEYFINPALK